MELTLGIQSFVQYVISEFKGEKINALVSVTSIYRLS